MPKPSTVRKTLLLAFSSISLISSSRWVMPMLKSPSVARMTRLMPSCLKCSAATRYAIWSPSPALVPPAAWSWSILERISSL